MAQENSSIFSCIANRKSRNLKKTNSSHTTQICWREIWQKLPAKGGARPDAMLLLSISTGFFSIKLLYIVQAALSRNTLQVSAHKNKLNISLSVTFYLLLAPRRRSWFYCNLTVWWQQLLQPAAHLHRSTPPPHQAPASLPAPQYQD